MQVILCDFKKHYSALWDNNIVLIHMSDHVKDNHTNIMQGYSFLSEGPFYQK